MITYTPYTYLIGWSALDRWYYGSETARIGKTAHPLNLWKTYFTSSKVVMEFRKLYGDPDIVEVRRLFSCGQQAIDWETKVLNRIDAGKNTRWLNLHNGNGVFRSSYHTEETKRKISKKCTGRIQSQSEIENRRKSNTGKKRSEEARKNLSDGAKSRVYTAEGLAKLKLRKGSNKGRKFSAETKMKMAEARSRYWARRKNRHSIL